MARVPDAKPDPMVEFAGIAMNTAGERAVMSKPRRLEATKKFIHEVQDELGLTDEQAPAAADWILNKMERWAAITARPVFDMDGNGPQCSMCSMIWPLCGHHHMSADVETDDDTEEGEQ